MGLGIFDSRMPALATKLVGRFAGPDGTSSLTITTQGAYDASDGSQAANSSSTTVTDVSPPVPVSERQVMDNNPVITGDLIVYIDGPQITLTRAMINNTVLSYLGTNYRMVWLNDYKSGENTAFYEVYLRDV